MSLLLEIDFELAYLALLTAKGIKPMSRWEKEVQDLALQALERLNLECSRVERKVQAGKRIRELIFSLDSSLLKKYSDHFEGTFIDKSPETLRREGKLFGYPSCCIEAFLQAPYGKNGLPREDQKILFHWACPECSETPGLLPRYREVHSYLEAQRDRLSSLKEST